MSKYADEPVDAIEDFPKPWQFVALVFGLSCSLTMLTAICMVVFSLGEKIIIPLIEWFVRNGGY